MSTDKNKKHAQNKSDKHLQESDTDVIPPDRNDGKNKRYPSHDEKSQPSQLLWWKDSQWWQVIFAAILIPFGIYAAVLIYPEQLVEMRKATKGATEGLALTREINRLDQRAWIATTGATGVPVEGQPMDVAVVIKNGGKTFGKDVAIRGCIRHVDKGLEPDFAKEIASVTPKSVGIMPPAGDYFSHGLTMPTVTKKYIADFKENRKDIFVFGEISYFDIFKCPHWTRFCYKLNARDWVWEIYKTGNDADDNTCP